MGENLSFALAKSCADQPLSDEETIQILAYLNHLMRRAERIASIDAVGEFGVDAERDGYELARQLLAVPMGRLIHEEYGGYGPPIFKAAPDRVVSNDDTNDPQYCLASAVD